MLHLPCLSFCLYSWFHSMFSIPTVLLGDPYLHDNQGCVLVSFTTTLKEKAKVMVTSCGSWLWESWLVYQSSWMLTKNNMEKKECTGKSLVLGAGTQGGKVKELDWQWEGSSMHQSTVWPWGTLHNLYTSLWKEKNICVLVVMVLVIS